jgi:hypothetical protein
MTSGTEVGERRPPWLRRAALAVGLATLLNAGGAAAQAMTADAVPCDDRATTKAFAQWGDDGDYFPMAGGDFERNEDWFVSGLSTAQTTEGDRGSVMATKVGWSVPAQPTLFVASDAPPLQVERYAAGRALVPVPPGYGSAPTSPSVTSRAVCTKVGEPTIRFFVNDPGIRGATLTVRVYQLAHEDRFSLSDRVVLQANEVTIASSGIRGWQPSPIVRTGAVHRPTADIVVAFQGVGGPWQVDNLYVDPFRSR